MDMMNLYRDYPTIIELTREHNQIIDTTNSIMKVIGDQDGYLDMIDIHSCQDIHILRTQLITAKKQIVELKQLLYSNRISLNTTARWHKDLIDFGSQVRGYERDIRDLQEDKELLTAALREFYPTNWWGRVKLLFRRFNKQDEE